MGREASEMSISSRQNFWNPPPVPEMPTVTLVPGFAFWNSSATASVIGYTVLEPSTWMTCCCCCEEACWLVSPPPRQLTENKATARVAEPATSPTERLKIYMSQG